jgi:hypothetical protein
MDRTRADAQMVNWFSFVWEYLRKKI